MGTYTFTVTIMLFAGPANQIDFFLLFFVGIPREAASGDSQSCISFHSALITGSWGILRPAYWHRLDSTPSAPSA
jgi:hypothetical protein